MIGRKKKTRVQADVAQAKELALALSRDRKFRKELLSAVRHGRAAKRRAVTRGGAAALAARIATDPKLRRELGRMTRNVQGAWRRAEKKRSHKLRNTLIVAGAGAAVAGAYGFRRRLGFGGAARDAGISTIDESIEVGVPVSTAYNQWTQFEDFPLFMEGVDDVRQLDDTRLHWAATVAGRRAEWDAKILEQHPDTQVSWISQDGRQTRGTVSFEPRGEGRTLIRLSMSYRTDGPVEALGSAAGLDRQRIRGDLQRFKELIESRGVETGAWRGEVTAGTTEENA